MMIERGTEILYWYEGETENDAKQFTVPRLFVDLTSLAEYIAEKDFEYNDYPEESVIHIKVDGKVSIWEVEVRPIPSFYALERKTK
jgi:hypothetical protein